MSEVIDILEQDEQEMVKMISFFLNTLKTKYNASHCFLYPDSKMICIDVFDKLSIEEKRTIIYRTCLGNLLPDTLSIVYLEKNSNKQNTIKLPTLIAPNLLKALSYYKRVKNVSS